MTWLTLFLPMAGGMLMVGAQVAQNGTRQFTMKFALAFSFSLVLFVIADLDLPP